jgi:hypothetical protein
MVLPGGSSPRPPFSRFARHAVTGKAPSLPCKSHQLDALRSLEDRRGKDHLASNLCNSTSGVRFDDLHEQVFGPGSTNFEPSKLLGRKERSYKSPSEASPGGLGGFPPGKKALVCSLLSDGIIRRRTKASILVSSNNLCLLRPLLPPPLSIFNDDQS